MRQPETPLHQDQSKEDELYSKKPFAEMADDILSGRWKQMKDIYYPGGHGEDYISERAENGHITLRNIMLGWDDKNKKVINEIVMVSESLYNRNKQGENKLSGFIMRNKDGEKFWDSRTEYDDQGFFKKHTIRDGQSNLLKVEEKENSEKTNIIYYDQAGQEGLKIVLLHQTGSLYEARNYLDASGKILETQEWRLLPSKHMKNRLDKDGQPIKLEYNKEHYQAKDYANPYYLKGYGEEAAAGYEKRMHEIWQKGYQV